MFKKIAIIGVGRLGKALCTGLYKSEFTIVGIHDLDIDIQTTFARKLEIPFWDNPYELINQADIIFLTLPDSLIQPMSKAISAQCQGDKYYFHCSGAHGLELLADLATHSHIGCFHPLQSFVGTQSSFADVYISIDGDADSCAAAERIAQALSAHTLNVPSSERALYHAAACILSNYLVSLNVVAERIFARWQIPKHAIEPLLLGSVHNIVSSPQSAAALTGPIVRGDSMTIAKHLAVIPQEYLALYKILGQATCKIAMDSKDNSDELKKIMQLLSS